MSSDGQLADGMQNLAVDKASRRRTGIVYDERMKKHHNVWDKTHAEVPGRISRPYEKHKEYGLLDRCKLIPARDATVEELLCQHSTEHVETMKSTRNMSLRELFTFGSQEYDSIYLSEHVYECASLSCGCTLAATEEVLTGKVQNAMAIVRPPGHHADTDFAMGYCFFNNVAIAAKIAQQKWNVKRVLIVDWDIHHGNGTQHLFESDPSVLYFSIHRYEHAKFFPFSTYANYDVVGQGSGEGYTVNVPWNKKHMGDADYLAVFQHVLLPIAYEFAPDLVLVSAGFDSARGDPKGLCDVTPEGYCQMTNMLMGLAGGKVVMALEGGYNLTSVAESMCACTSTLLGDPCPKIEEALVPSDSALETIANVVGEQQKYWKSLRHSGFRISTQEKIENSNEEDKKSVTPVNGTSEAEIPVDHIAYC